MSDREEVNPGAQDGEGNEADYDYCLQYSHHRDNRQRSLAAKLYIAK